MRYRERRDSVLVESLLIIERDTEDGSGAAACPPFTSDDTPHQPSVAYHEVGKHIVKRQQIAFLASFGRPVERLYPRMDTQETLWKTKSQVREPA